MSKRSLNLHRAVSNHPSNQGLVGWWLTLPGMIGGPRHRDIFAGNHAVLQAYSPPTGPNIVADGTSSRFGAMVLDGDDKHGAEAQIVGAATLNLSGPLTISWWMQNHTSGAYGFSACVCDSGINGIGLDYSQVQQNSSGSTLTSSPVRLAPNKYYLLYTQDATTNYLYVNGVLYSSTTNARNNVNLSRVWFGKNTYLSGSQAPPAGDLVGDLRLRRTYTSAAEAAFLYQQRLKGYPDLLAYRSWVSFAKSSSSGESSVSVSETGTGVDLAAISFTKTDSGTGNDSNSIITIIPVSVSDVATGVDSISLSVFLNGTDAATGIESFSISTAVPLNDTAVGTESTTNISFTKTESATGTEATPNIKLNVVEFATGAETYSYTASITGSDSGIGVDAGGTGTFTPVSVSDTATASETINVVVSFAVIENGTGVDLSSLSARIFGIDSANGIESILTNVVVSTNDTATGIDSFTVFTSTISTSNVYLFFIN